MSKLTKGPIIPSLLKLAIPIVLANLLHMAYQLIDTFWVGRLGGDAVAAISFSFPLMYFLLSLGGGLAIAGTILVAQYRGKKAFGSVNYIAGQTVLVLFAVAIAISVVGYFITPWAIKAMGAQASILGDASLYTRILFIGVIVEFIFFAFESLMRGVGDVKTPLFIVGGAVLLNAIFDPVLIFGWGPIPAFGVAGAGYATVLTNTFSAVFALAIMFKGRKGIRIRFDHLKPNWKLYKKLLQIGLPASLEQSNRALGMIVMTAIAAAFGTVAVAAYGVTIRLVILILVPALGFSIATSTMIGQNMGAGKIKRAEEVAVKAQWLAFGTLSFFAVIMFLWAEPITRFFVPQDVQVIQAAVGLIKFVAPSFGFIGAVMVINGIFRGAGLTKIPMLLTFFQYWILRIPLSLIFTRWIGILGVGLGILVGNTLTALFSWVEYIRGEWKTKRITEEVKLASLVKQESELDLGIEE